MRSHSIRITATIPYSGAHPGDAREALLMLFRGALATAASAVCEPGAEPVSMDGVDVVATVDAPPPSAIIEAIGPAQINWLDQTQKIATITYPADADTVLSIQPNGQPDTRPAGTDGIYERCIVQPDRLIYNPTGPTGRTFVVPYTSVVPNTV